MPRFGITGGGVGNSGFIGGVGDGSSAGSSNKSAAAAAAAAAAGALRGRILGGGSTAGGLMFGGSTPSANTMLSSFGSSSLSSGGGFSLGAGGGGQQQGFSSSSKTPSQQQSKSKSASNASMFSSSPPPPCAVETPPSSSNNQRRQRQQQNNSYNNNIASNTSSVCLSCTSSITTTTSSSNRNTRRNGSGSNKYYVHSLNLQKLCIDTQLLPVDDEYESGKSSSQSTIIQTPLPAQIRDALGIDPPLELLWCCYCCDGDNKIATNLCLYTSKSVFLIVIEYNDSADSNNDDYDRPPSSTEVGRVVSVIEPFESTLLMSNVVVLRVRSGPSSQSGGSSASGGCGIICPPNSLAMLSFNQDLHEYSITLCHNIKTNNTTTPTVTTTTTTPLVFAVEELVDPNERVVDFCFVTQHQQQPGNLSLFASLSILLVKGTGDVLCASPIVFDGSIVMRNALNEVCEYLQHYCDSARDRNTAKWRQCRAAQQYVMDVFGGNSTSDSSSNQTYFVTARILDDDTTSQNSAASWPVRIQGPVFFETEPSSPSCRTIETVGRASSSIGIALGRDFGHVDLVVMSPTALLPRFSFEHYNDSNEIDDAIFQLSALVGRVSLQQGDDQDDTTRRNRHTSAATTTARNLSLIPDPAVDTLIHYVNESFVATISTHVIHNASCQLMGHHHHHHHSRSSSSTTETTAWLNLSVPSSTTPLRGAVVTGQQGYGPDQVIVRLADGSLVPINVTERQFLQDINNFWDEQDRKAKNAAAPLALMPSTTTTTASDGDAANRRLSEALLELESTKPMHQLTAPLLEKINSGLSGLCKIVGTQTAPRDIEPDALAVALDLQSRCNEQIVEPLLELKRVVKKRRQKLQAMVHSQQQQLTDLNATISRLQRGMSNIQEQMEKAETNAQLLSERSDRALQASRGLLPTITQAEYEFLRDMKRLDRKTKTLEEESDKIIRSIESKKKKVLSEANNMKKNTNPDDQRSSSNNMFMDEHNAERANVMLDSSGITLKQMEDNLTKTEKVLRNLTTATTTTGAGRGSGSGSGVETKK